MVATNAAVSGRLEDRAAVPFATHNATYLFVAMKGSESCTKTMGTLSCRRS
jgi:hypothetical protein